MGWPQAGSHTASKICSERSKNCVAVSTAVIRDAKSRSGTSGGTWQLLSAVVSSKVLAAHSAMFRGRREWASAKKSCELRTTARITPRYFILDSLQRK